MARCVVVGLILVGVLGACSKKRNPDKCCVSETDCAAVGLPNGSTCGEHELCRGNECIELTCTASPECDPTAPYCTDGYCTTQCSSDDACPAFGEEGRPVCVNGACLECREAKDCSDNLVCIDNSCVACISDDECVSGVCAGGSCVDDSSVAFTHPTGSGTSNCTKADPCTLVRALTIVPARPNIKLADGMYQNTGTISLFGARTISGNGPDKTSVTNLGSGPVFTIDAGDHTIFGMKIFGATTANGVGVKCPTASGQPTLNIMKTLVTQNASDGISSTNCKLTVSESRFVANGGFGARVSSVAAPTDMFKIERSSFEQNTTGGVQATGPGTLRNLFAIGNGPLGIEVQAVTADVGMIGRVLLEFSTIAENGTGVSCPVTGATTKSTVSNVLLVNNSMAVLPMQPMPNSQCMITTCFVTGSQPIGSPCTSYDISEFGFGAAYHLGTNGSVAVDRASGTTALDFDGEPRPKGSASDVGADEAF